MADTIICKNPVLWIQPILLSVLMSQVFVLVVAPYEIDVRQRFGDKARNEQELQKCWRTLNQASINPNLTVS